MEGETEAPRIDQKSFFLFLYFLLKIQDIRKSKTPIFEKRLHKNFLGQLLTIFQTSFSLKNLPVATFAYSNIQSFWYLIHKINFLLMEFSTKISLEEKIDT